MLIYLDTSHFDKLERLCSSDYSQFTSFIDQWTTKEYVVALSLNHAQEFSQLADEVSRQRRLDVIRQFPSEHVQFSPRGSVELLEMELVFEIYAYVSGIRKPIKDIQRMVFTQKFDAFAAIVNESVEASHQGFAARKTLADGFNELAKVGRDIENLRIAHNLPRVDLTDPNIDWEQMVKLMEDTLPRKVEDTPSGRILNGFFRQMNDLIKKHKNVRKAFEELYGLMGMEVTSTLRPTDLIFANMFFSSAREKIQHISEALKIPLQFLMALLPKLNPYKMPGYSLGMAINRARQLSGNLAETGDQVDESHITFAPYVDMLFVDKRTFAFFNQELRDRHELIVPPPNGRVRFAGTVEKLKQELGL